MTLSDLWLRAIMSIEGWIDDSNLRQMADLICGTIFGHPGGRPLVQALLTMASTNVQATAAKTKRKGLISGVLSLFRAQIGPTLSFGTAGKCFSRANHTARTAEQS